MRSPCQTLKQAGVAGSASIALWAAAASAHHSPAGYDLQAQRTIEGTVTEYDWGNPHVYLSVRENGSNQVWVVDFEDKAVVTFDQRSGTRQHMYQVDGAPQDVFFDGTSIWVACYDGDVVDKITRTRP